MSKRRLAVGVVLASLAAGACAEGRPRLLAHRGGAKERDENSLGAFRACYEQGLRGFETDVRLTKDGALVILHDDTLERTTTGSGAVENLTAAEVKAIRLKKSGEPLPRAQELLAYFRDKPDVFVELEMKTGNTNQYTAARLETYCRALYEAAKAEMPPGTYCFTSFDARALQTMKRLHPDACTGLIVGGGLDEKQIELAKALKVQQIGPVMDGTTRKAVREAHKAGFRLTGWPTVSEADYALGVAMGFDNLTTDIPVQLFESAAKAR